jgi:hypothetical protein
MRSLERHRDAGAYALGVLDERDAFRFEDHLMGCPRCTATVTGFRPVARQLLLYRRATPSAVHPFAGPGPRLLERLLGEVAAGRKGARRRLWCVTAGALLCVAAEPGVALLAAPGEEAVRVAATDARTGVWARVTAENRPWGSGVEIEVKGGAGARSCRLVAVGRDGSEATVAGWHVSGHDARPTTVRGGAALHPGEIARYEVRTDDGRPLVSLPGGS